MTAVSSDPGVDARAGATEAPEPRRRRRLLGENPLGLLFSEGRLTMKELAERLQITPPSVTILVRRLVQTALVQRTTHPQDSRVTLLSLTDEGRELYDSLAESQIRRLALLLSGLNAEEQEQFLGLLERAVRAFAVAPAAGDAQPTGD